MPKPLDLSQEAYWKKRFHVPSVIYSQIASQNPERGIVITNKDGAYQIYAWDVTNDDLHQLTHHPNGVIQGVISADGERVYYLHDEQGNEIGHYFSIPWAGGEPTNLTPSFPVYASFWMTECASGKYLGFMTANQNGFQIFAIDREAGGLPHLRYESAQLSIGPVFSYDGEISIVASTERSTSLDFSLEAYNTQTGEKIAELWDGEGTSILPIHFAPVAGDFRYLASSNMSGYTRPLLWNPMTNEREDLALQSIQGDVQPWAWSKDGEKILLAQLYEGTYQLYTYTVADHGLTKLNHPLGTYAIGGYFTKGGTIITISESSTHPRQLIELDGDTGELISTRLSVGEIPSSIPWKAISFPSSDGTEIQAWLATPEGEAPYPTIVHAHGGPTDVVTDMFLPEAQAWLDHGFAFLTINYRGSTTFGKDFEYAIRGNLGDLEVDDLVAGTQYLIDQGIAQRSKILLTGASYGGYLTLQSLGKRSDLWAGGMAIVAIADWELMYEDQAETLKAAQRGLFGGTPDELPEQTRLSSPITYAEQVQGDILVIQGRNDSRCPSRQMEVYIEKMKSLGKSIEVIWFDAGHISMQTHHQIEHQEAMLTFAYRTLGYNKDHELMRKTL